MAMSNLFYKYQGLLFAKGMQNTLSYLSASNFNY